MSNPRKPLAVVIEDDLNLANAFSYALDEFDVKTFYNGQEAFDWLQEETVAPNIVVLDLNLPGVPGKNILEYIRSQERMKKTRVFIASANALLSESLREKADLVLLKPIGFKQLQMLANKFKERA